MINKQWSILILLLVFFSCQSSPIGNNLPSLRLISHNVYYGFTKTPERKTKWLKWMQEQHPDIVSLQELNTYTPDMLKKDAASWGHPYSVLLKEEGFPTGITSRFPIADVHRYIEGFHHGLIRVKIQDTYIYVIHLHPSNWQVRHREIDFILKNISELPDLSKVVLAGDFNTFAPVDSIYYQHGRLEPFFQSLDRRDNANNLNNNQLDYGVIQKILDFGLIDLEYQQRNSDYNFTGSFPALLETEGEHGDLRRLDYIFTTPNIASRVKLTKIIADDTTQYLSDHLPVLVEWSTN